MLCGQKPEIKETSGRRGHFNWLERIIRWGFVVSLGITWALKSSAESRRIWMCSDLFRAELEPWWGCNCATTTISANPRPANARASCGPACIGGWEKDGVSLFCFILRSITLFQVSFVGVRGTSFKGDIALDVIITKPGECSKQKIEASHKVEGKNQTFGSLSSLVASCNAWL